MPSTAIQKEAKRMWRLSQHDQTKAIVIAEPKHRSTAIGLSSGISVRQFPKSTVEKVREICIHYVEKCSGKYENNKVAARYVHQMADEVINQLAGVAAQLRTMRANGPEKFQNLLDEWNENFPETLGAYGTPKNVAATLLKQTAELEQLRNELEKERLDRSVEISQILKSVDAQLHASCAGVMSERRRQSLAQQQQYAEFEKREQTADINSGVTVQTLRESYDASIAKIQKENKKLNRQYARRNELLKTEIDAVNTARSIDKIEAEKILQSEREAHLKSFTELQEQTKSKESPLPSPLRRSTQIPPKSPGGRTSRDGTNSKTNESPNQNVDSTANRPSEEILEDRRREDDGGELICRLLSQVDCAHRERDLYRNRIDDLENLNEALRRALSLQLYNRVDNSGIKAAATLFF